MVEDWSLGRGFRGTQARDIPTDGQQIGETPFHTPEGAGKDTMQGRKIGVKRNVNGFGGGVKSARYPDGQANSGNINRATGHGAPVAEVESEKDDATLDKVAPPKGHVAYKTRH